jgi:HAD superfamily hydrolase (TIGR01549 family)
VKAVVFDFGYTLVDEDRVWKAAANDLGWPASVFFAALGSVIEQRRRHRDVLEILGGDGRQQLAPFEPSDFYVDALPTLSTAKKSGLIVGIAGNFSREIEAFLADHTDVDFIASSERWGVEKPNSEFFSRIVGDAGCEAADITYVGDRLDNDVLPAAKVGMAPVWIIRGPWAVVQQGWPEAKKAVIRIRELAEMPL